MMMVTMMAMASVRGSKELPDFHEIPDFIFTRTPTEKREDVAIVLSCLWRRLRELT
jgi:hypothetical protein